ncbi:hypothetical protein HKD37_13G035633 [Glycine soja]
MRAYEKDVLSLSLSWENIIDLEEQQRHHLQRLHVKGVLWKPPLEEEDSSSLSSSALKFVVLGLYDHDKKSLVHGVAVGKGGEDFDMCELQRRTMARFLEDLGFASFEEREAIHDTVLGDSCCSELDK